MKKQEKDTQRQHMMVLVDSTQDKSAPRRKKGAQTGDATEKEAQSQAQQGPQNNAQKQEAEKLLKERKKKESNVRWHNIAAPAWTIISWTWITLIIALLVQFVPSYLLNNDVKSTFWNAVILPWFGNPSLPFPWNVCKILVLVAICLLIVLTPIAFVIEWKTRPKYAGFETLLEVLQNDTIFPVLEKIRKRLQQQIEQQEKAFQELQRITALLERLPTLSDQKESMQELEKIATLLEGLPAPTNWQDLIQAQRTFLQQEISVPLQEMQETTVERSELAGQKMQKIVHLLQEIRDRLERIPLPDQRALRFPEQIDPSGYHVEQEEDAGGTSLSA